MKICAVVVVYNPDKKELAENLATYAQDVDTLIVWDNTPDGAFGPGQEDKGILPANALLMGENRNAGLGYAFNVAAQYAAANGFTHLLTMDQNSRWENFRGFRDFVARSGTESIFTPLLSYEERGDAESEPRRQYINSGALYPLRVIERIGDFNEDFFIDAIDKEYGIRARKKGIAIMRYNLCRLVHQLGYHRSIGGHDVNCYSAFRLYYLNRNCIKMFRRQRDAASLRECLFYFKQFALKRGWQIVRYEDRKLSKLSAIARGVFSGLFSRLR